jgi:hypothetical protein
MKVILIAGSGRSGSTLLERLIGLLDPRIFCMGEFHAAWAKGYGQNRLCGCGKPVRECPVWSTVFVKTFGELSDKAIQEIISLKQEVERMRYLWKLLWPRLASQPFFRRKCEYQQKLLSFFNMVCEVTGAQFLVDSSKQASHGLVLAGIPEIELYVLHLVRHPCAVVFSWQRRKRQRAVYWDTVYMERRGLLRASAFWVAHNIAAWLLKSRLPPGRYMRLRYEELAREPETALGKIAEWLGFSPPSGLFENLKVFLPPNHLIAGNPMRFDSGTITIRLDEEWRLRMPWWKKVAVMCLTSPALWLLKSSLGGEHN